MIQFNLFDVCMLRTLLPLLVFCALSAVMLLQKPLGFLLYALVPILLIYMGMQAWKTRHDAKHLPSLAVQMLLCFTTISSIAMVHGRYHQQTRAAANDVLKHIQAYQQQHQAYPTSLQAAAITIDRTIGIQYHHANNTPTVSYPSTFAPDTTFVYDFAGQSWHKHSD